MVVKKFLNLLRIFDARAISVIIGFILVYLGVAGEVNHHVAMIVIGTIILLKGLTKWV